jgi:hypothetical protein
MEFKSIIESYFKQSGLEPSEIKEEGSVKYYSLQSGEQEARIILPKSSADPFEIDVTFTSPEGKFVIYASDITTDSFRGVVEELTKTINDFLKRKYTLRKRGIFSKHLSLEFNRDLVFNDAVVSRR